ncbi:hypothetical protein L1077_08530 [Pseudoalteromonas luteoviolacea]|uniref:hypothetical protein n=1 Tax=Pseudoalteromonas luteoviolacea TaxID=43657 RepID=UPI001F1C2768|nr:hypothetical protein [Pseudoalteromonas luteoviolacea]MCF6439474.1 hypothetical protein [Pseudoalteromonas luteoviolacea]
MYGEYQVEIHSIELLQTWLDKPWAIVHVVYDTTPNDADDSAYSDGYIVMRLADNALEQLTGLSEGIIYRQTSSVSQQGKTQLKLVDGDKNGDTNTAWYDLGDLQSNVVF